MNMQSVTSTAYGDLAQYWNRLPHTFQRRWLAADKYERVELFSVASRIIDGEPYADPNEQPPEGQENNPRKVREAHIAATKVKRAKST